MTIHQIKMYQEFNASIEQVWEAFNNHENFGKIMGEKIIRIKDSTDSNNINGLDSVRLIKLPFIPFEETIRKSERLNCIEYQITKGGPFKHHYGKMLFSSLSNNKTALNYTIEIGATIPLVSLVLKTILQFSIEKGLKNYANSL